MRIEKNWVCRITDDLPQAMALPHALSLESDERLPFQEALPGLLLSIANVPAAAMGFHRQPDRTLALSAPIFPDATLSSEIRARMLALMLTTAEAEAAAAQCTVIRYLQATTESLDHPWMQAVLQNAGFAVVAEIVPWTATALLSSGVSSSPRDFTAPAFTADQSDAVRYETLWASSLETSSRQLRTCTHLLRSILSNSDDLTGMPPASADSLLQDWITENACLVLAYEERVAVALCACAVLPDRSYANTADVRICYVGVHPNYRRMKFATNLLTHLPSTLQTLLLPPRSPVRFTAFGDVRNEPATALYKGSGFMPGESSLIWLRCLKKS